VQIQTQTKLKKMNSQNLKDGFFNEWTNETFNARFDWFKAQNFKDIKEAIMACKKQGFSFTALAFAINHFSK